MAFSQTSRTRLSYIPEVTFGVTPVGNFQEIPITTGTNLNITKSRLQSQAIYSDRQPRHDRHGNIGASGQITCELSNQNYDDLLEGLMMSTWDASPVASPDELKVGTTIKTFTFEDYAADIDQARLFTGCGISSGSFRFSSDGEGSMVETTFEVLGASGSISVLEKTVTSAPINQPFDSYNGSLEIGDTGGALSGINTITQIELNVNNNIEQAYVVGSPDAQQLLYGNCTVEGNITAYFEDTSLYNRFLNETETAFEVTVTAPGGTTPYSFFIPKAKFNGGDIPVQGTARMITIPFVALYDATEGSLLTIKRPDST